MKATCLPRVSLLLRHGPYQAVSVVLACPSLRKITTANFELASRDKIIYALSRLPQLEEFNIRVYLESRRRSSEFCDVIKYCAFRFTCPLVQSHPPFQSTLTAT
jgi:hypothetical protein